LRFLKWLNLRGGIRTDIFTFDILDNLNNGARTSTAAIVPMPRGSLILGPFEGFSFSTSVGAGVQTADPSFITQNPTQTPYASVLGVEAGASFSRVVHNDTLITARSVFFQTHVSNDLFFAEDVGRNVLGVGTSRTGWLGAARVTGRNFDLSTNATIVNSQFDDTHLPVDYVPPVVVRADAAVYGDLPLAIDHTKLHVTFSTGFSWAARRPLPNDFMSEEIFTVDASLFLRWRQFELGVSGTNLTNNMYRVGEFAFVSDFHNGSPSAAPVRMFNAGPPLGVFASLQIKLGSKP